MYEKQFRLSVEVHLSSMESTHKRVYTTFTAGGAAERYRSRVMYRRMFQKAGRTRRFTITDAGTLGWEVSKEQDSQIVWSVRYTDWHRVERARMTFALEAATLASAGWKES